MRHFIQVVEEAGSEAEETGIWFDCLTTTMRNELKTHTSRYHDSDAERDARAIAYISDHIDAFKAVFADTADHELVHHKWAELMKDMGDKPHGHISLTNRQSNCDQRQITREVARGE